MSTPESTEYHWGMSFADKKPLMPEQIQAKKERQVYNAQINKAYKKVHPELSKGQIRQLAAKSGGYHILAAEIDRLQATDKIDQDGNK